MKFLMISKLKDVFWTLPREERAQLMLGTAAWRDRYLKAGKCLESYTMPGWGRFVSIWEIESGEEAARLVAELPLGSFMDMESYPLADWDVYVKAVMEANR